RLTRPGDQSRWLIERRICPPGTIKAGRMIRDNDMGDGSGGDMLMKQPEQGHHVAGILIAEQPIEGGRQFADGARDVVAPLIAAYHPSDRERLVHVGLLLL